MPKYFKFEKRQGDVMAPRVPAPVLTQLANPSGNGDRHRQMKNTVKSLLGNGMSPDAVFEQYRSMYAEDVSDNEIRSVIDWEIGTNPGPSGFENGTPRPIQKLSPSTVKAKPVTSEEAIKNARVWLGAFAANEQRLRECSKECFPCDASAHAIAFLLALYSDEELVCINTEHSVETKKDGALKAVIEGAGQTLHAGDWIDIFFECGNPLSDAGAWFRLNPVKSEEGSGYEGAHTDADVAAFRYLLIESDKLPLDLQLSILAKIKLPIAAIYLSGGASAHAAVKLDSPDIETHRSRAAHIMSKLAVFGFDLSNVNPSRYSRLPGCKRKIGARGDGVQRLLYVNRDPKRGEAICQ